MDLGITGEVAIVTASSSGLGLASAKALLEEGVSVVLNGRDPSKFEAVGLPATSAAFVEGDIGDESTRIRLIETAHERFGAPRIFVGNTGGPPPGAALDATGDELTEACRTLLVPLVDMTGKLLPSMLESGWGRIVFITSAAVREPVPRLIASNSLRMAVHGYAKTLSREVAQKGVTVNCVMPGRIDTARVRTLDAENARREGVTETEIRDRNERAIPAGRYGRPDEFGRVVAFLCSRPASYITGASIPVDGGLLRSHF